MPSSEMVAAVSQVLTLCQKVGLKFQKIDLDSGESIAGFAYLVESMGIEPEQVVENAAYICQGPDFPTPADVVRICEEHDGEPASPPMASYSLPGKQHFLGPPDMTREQVEAHYAQVEALPERCSPEDKPALPKYMEGEEE